MLNTDTRQGLGSGGGWGKGGGGRAEAEGQNSSPILQSCLKALVGQFRHGASRVHLT